MKHQTCGGTGGGAMLVNGSRCLLWIGIGAAMLIGGWLPNTKTHTHVPALITSRGKHLQHLTSISDKYTTGLDWAQTAEKSQQNEGTAANLTPVCTHKVWHTWLTKLFYRNDHDSVNNMIFTHLSNLASIHTEICYSGHKVGEKNSLSFPGFSRAINLLFHRLSQQKVNVIMTFIKGHSTLTPAPPHFDQIFEWWTKNTLFVTIFPRGCTEFPEFSMFKEIPEYSRFSRFVATLTDVLADRCPCYCPTSNHETTEAGQDTKTLQRTDGRRSTWRIRSQLLLQDLWRDASRLLRLRVIRQLLQIGHQQLWIFHHHHLLLLKVQLLLLLLMQLIKLLLLHCCVVADAGRVRMLRHWHVHLSRLQTLQFTTGHITTNELSHSYQPLLHTLLPHRHV